MQISITTYIVMPLGDIWEDKNMQAHMYTHTHSLLKTSKVKGR